MKKLIRMVMDAAKQGDVPVTICGLAVGNPANATQYLQLGLRSFSMSPQNLLEAKKALLEADALPEDCLLYTSPCGSRSPASHGLFSVP